MGQYMSKPWWGESTPATDFKRPPTPVSEPEPVPVRDAHIPMLSDAECEHTRVSIASLETPEGRAAFRAVVQEHGFAVVDGVLPDHDVAEAESLWSQDLRTIIERTVAASTAAASDDEASGEPVATPPAGKLAGLEEGAEARTFPTDKIGLGAKFVTEYGLVQGRMPWFVRRHENVVSVFAALHEQEPEMKDDPRALCVGTDAVFYSNDALGEDADCGALEDYLWPHVDHNKALEPHASWNTYQSIVYVWPATERSKSTVILPRGNGAAAHAKYLADAPPMPSQFTPIHARHFREFAAEARRIPVPAGGMVVWACKTIHQGWSHGDRLAVPVCYEPRWRRPADALARKRAAVKRGQPTTHWASIGLVHGRPCKPVRIDETCRLHHRAHHHCLRLKTADGHLSDDSDVEIDPDVDACL